MPGDGGTSKTTRRMEERRAAKARKVAKAMLLEADGVWSVSIDNAAGTSWEGDLDGYATAGAALDALAKWADDRGLAVDWYSAEFVVLRPTAPLPSEAPDADNR